MDVSSAEGHVVLVAALFCAVGCHHICWKLVAEPHLADLETAPWRQLPTGLQVCTVL